MRHLVDWTATWLQEGTPCGAPALLPPLPTPANAQTSTPTSLPRLPCSPRLQELILFSRADLERSIPNMVDGLKPGQRKIMFACFKRNLKSDVKVAQLAGYVAEHSGGWASGRQWLMAGCRWLSGNATQAARLAAQRPKAAGPSATSH